VLRVSPRRTLVDAGRHAADAQRPQAAVAHLRAAIDRNTELGCTVWRLDSEHRPHGVAPDDALAADVAAGARALGIERLAR